MANEKDKDKDTKELKIETVKMVREVPDFPGGPVTADVHPDEVEGFNAAGWVKEAGKSKEKA